MVKRQFDYEDKYKNIQNKIRELEELSGTLDFDLSSEIKVLEGKLKSIRDQKYQNLTPWEKVLLARHPERPTTIQYLDHICDEWIELHGDRYYGDDPAIVGGIGTFNGMPVTVIGHQRGKDTNENIKRNFGMPHPEGYRKVHRLLKQAEKFGRPVLTFIDTQGAYPGAGAEERGQPVAIAQDLMLLAGLNVPIISTVIGEGGSGGALALGVGDRLIMLSNSVFSVASAETCGSILAKDPNRAEEMAAALKLTADDLKSLNIVDEVVPEPIGGAHTDPLETITRVKEAIARNLYEVMENGGSFAEQRYQRLRSMGRYNIIA
ncbi:MAG: acetyl-CoA carboxylase carboxyltransferase subunit alpha [Syntrophomonadaceae bacterium]|jgi:acetyl-CoA carboxylase carboxyl transferase subunit alpha|nr:acetyl-CoA carboxylase carboxyltransferase subunit alpha [Syntrophomonadaceae bacterium]